MTDREIPKGWRKRHNAWYYSVPMALRSQWDNKTEYRLGKTLEEAWAEWDSKTLLLPTEVQATVNYLLDKYDRDIVSTKTWKTQESNRISMARIRAVFGRMRIPHVQAAHVAQYRDRVAATAGKTSANRDLEVISHAYTKAIEWGLCTEHPVKGLVKKNKLPPRGRYVEDWEVAAALTVAPPSLVAYIWIKLATGQRRKDLLSLTLADIRPDSEGIRIKPSKTAQSSGRKILILWTPDLLAWRDYALSVRPPNAQPFVFVNNKGAGWLDIETGRANGFDTLWQRFMSAVLSKTTVVERFQERDLRAKTASDTDLIHASRLLAHTSQQITQTVYRRKGDTVEPVDTSHIFKAR